MGAENGPGRYRVNKHFALPKFISPRNPFARVAESVAEAASAPKQSPPSQTGKRAGFRSRLVSPCMRILEVSKSAVLKLRSWTLGLNPFSRASKWPSLCDPHHCRRAELPKKPTQAELSLDTVRVVRNDLSDADFEIAPTKSLNAGLSAKQPAARFELLTSVGNAWDRLSAKIFRVGQT